jgi:outer membrane lipoprotein-sorting protein
MKRIILIILVCGMSFSAPRVQVYTGDSGNKEVRNFMNETIAIIKSFTKSVKKFSANISIKQKVAGVKELVSQDCRVEYQKPGYLKMVFKGLYPYTVVVSNYEVFTTIKSTGETDVRGMRLEEDLFEHFLGIGYFKNIKLYNLRFRTEGDLYVLKGEMPLKYQIPLRRNIVENAYRTIFIEIWLDPISGLVKKSHIKSLGGREAYYTFRDWQIDNGKKKIKK